jgi:ATP-dependent Clp protease ATP-binding subunit ClpC
MASDLLYELGVTPDVARTRVVELLGRNEPLERSQLPFTPVAADVLRTATAEADSMNHGWVSTEHVLLGLAGVENAGTRAVLDGFGLDQTAIAAAVHKAIG